LQVEKKVFHIAEVVGANGRATRCFRKSANRKDIWTLVSSSLLSHVFANRGGLYVTFPVNVPVGLAGASGEMIS
jgi:hypothetical protein